MMADTVSVNEVINTITTYIVHLTNESDGTGESAVKKVDLSDLTTSQGTPGTISLIEALWSIKGGYVTLEWDHASNEKILVCSGNNSISYEDVGGKVDPQAGSNTGNVVLTTDAFADGDSYDITLIFKKKYA